MERILFLNHLGVLGGAELTLIDVARRYRETSTVVLFVDGPLRRRLEAAGVRVHILQSRWALEGEARGRPLLTPRTIGEVGRLATRIALLARNHDLVYANSQKALIVACASRLLIRKPILCAAHEILELEHFSRLQIRLNVGLANRFATRIVAHSEAIAHAFSRWGGRTDRLHVVHYGIDLRPFVDVRDADVQAVRNELELQQGPVIGLFGRLTWWKGQHVALDALSRLPNVQALFVGEPFAGDGYDVALRDRARRSGVADRVRFLGFRDDVPCLMKLVDVILHTSISPEPFGRVIVEGMLAAKPVVATDAGGVREIVENGVTGVLVRPGCPEELAVAVTSLLGNPERANALASAGYAHASARFTLDRMIDGISRHITAVARR